MVLDKMQKGTQWTIYMQLIGCIMMCMDTHDDKVFKALADANRRQLLDRMHQQDAGLTLSELCKGHSMSRQAVTKHLAILEAANLVVTIKLGREKLHFLDPVPINDIYTRWIGKFENGTQSGIKALNGEIA